MVIILTTHHGSKNLKKRLPSYYDEIQKVKYMVLKNIFKNR